MAKLSHIARLSNRAKFMLAGAIFFGCLNTLLIPAPFLAAWLILRDLMAGDSDRGLYYLELAALAVLLRWFCQLASISLSHYAALLVSQDLRHRLLQHLGALPMYWHSGQSLGALKKVYTNDISQVDSFIAHHIIDAVTAVFLPVVAIICLTWINRPLGLALIMMVISCFIVQAGSYRAMQGDNLWARTSAALEALNASAIEFIQGMPVIKLFNRDLESFARMRSAVNEYREIQIMGYTVYAPRWALFSFITVMPFIVLAILGSALYAAGQISLENLALFLMLSGATLAPISKLIRLSAMLMEAQLSIGRIKGILDEPPGPTGTVEAVAVTDYTVTVENLTVCYGEKTALAGVSFTVPSGTTTAIVGPSGSGKSTLAAVLAGMEHIASGRVNIGGYDLEDFGPSELSRIVSPVFQSPFMFTGSIAENIALGRPEADDQAIFEAAQAARCLDFIEALPHGLATRIGDGGETHLSGGQRQRVALARVLLRNSPVLVLDEATAYADAESEAQIQAALSTMTIGRSVIVVAHRLHTIAGADQILVLNEGHVVECGTHEELLTLDGRYAKMWQAHHQARSWVIQGLK
ncbi:MAG: ABC transporter ATP-binding protein/permease [Candidatus Adiutrix sp.]|jgi:ATP-binding cassette subfamily B protein|nr:ABC transporter ATP-binding protein/permease [Candidatus Adiutrix sp.]